MKTTRRSFLKRTLGAGAALAMPGFAPGALWGQNAPSNRITIGLIGMGLQMGGHRGGMTGRQDVQVLAVCDVHRGRLQAAKAAVESAYSQRTASGSYKGCAAYHEYERVMERGDIDAVMICTPDHWHAPISVAAMRSGKDVFVQKPMTLTIREGRIMSDVARQRGAILQVGSQQRSERAFRRACEMVRNGWIGKVKTIYASLGEFPPPRTLPEQPIPEASTTTAGLGPRRGIRTIPIGSKAIMAAAGAAFGTMDPGRTGTGARTISTSSSGRWARTIPAQSSSSPKATKAPNSKRMSMATASESCAIIRT